MDKLQGMETFVRIVDAGTLTAAAESLGRSLPAVVRSLAALEARLGTRLLNRTTRRLAMTDEGRDYYERCRRVLADVEEAEAALSARRATPRGRLRVTASVLFGRLHVAPALAAFAAAHREVQAELLLFDRVVDLVEEGLDAGVRIGPLPDSTLVAIPVGELRRVLCASPAYLAAGGEPRSPADLHGHRSVGFTGLSPNHEWTLREGEHTLRVAMKPGYVCNQVDAALDACAASLGIGQFLSYQAQAMLSDGRLLRLLPGHEPAPVPVHVVYPGTRILSSTVRAFLDHAVTHLRDALRNTA